MPDPYSQATIEKAYTSLPSELKEAFGSLEAADQIEEIAERNGVQQADTLIKLVGYVILGLLPLAEFEKAAQEQVKPATAAKKVAQEIHRLILFPLRPSLEAFTAGQQTAKETGGKTKKQQKTDIPAKQSDSDPYRESVDEEE